MDKVRPELKILKEIGAGDPDFLDAEKKMLEARKVQEERAVIYRAGMRRIGLSDDGRILREILERVVVQDVYNPDERQMLLLEGHRQMAKHLLSLMHEREHV